MRPSVEDTAERFDRACKAAGVDYAFIGALAVSAWGQSRASEDIDVLVAFRREQAGSLASALADQRLSVEAFDLEAAFKDRSHVTVFDDGGGPFHLDLKIAFTPRERKQVLAASEVRLAHRTVAVARPEDTIAFKLHYGSPQDLQDARSILVRQEGKLDEARLSELAFELGVDQVLAQMREEIASIDGE